MISQDNLLQQVFSRNAKDERMWAQSLITISMHIAAFLGTSSKQKLRYASHGCNASKSSVATHCGKVSTMASNNDDYIWQVLCGLYWVWDLEQTCALLDNRVVSILEHVKLLSSPVASNPTIPNLGWTRLMQWQKSSKNGDIMISTLHFLKSYAGTHRPSWGPSSGNWKHSLHEGEASFPCK